MKINIPTDLEYMSGYKNEGFYHPRQSNNKSVKIIIMISAKKKKIIKFLINSTINIIIIIYVQSNQKKNHAVIQFVVFAYHVYQCGSDGFAALVLLALCLVLSSQGVQWRCLKSQPLTIMGWRTILMVHHGSKLTMLWRPPLSKLIQDLTWVLSILILKVPILKV